MELWAYSFYVCTHGTTEEPASAQCFITEL